MPKFVVVDFYFKVHSSVSANRNESTSKSEVEKHKKKKTEKKRKAKLAYFYKVFKKKVLNNVFTRKDYDS